jgi:hypothetical protein
MHGFRRAATLLLLLAALTLAVAACGGSGESGGGSSDGGTTAYTNDQYDFAMTYDTRFTEGKPVEGTSAGASAVFDVVFADKQGTIVSDRYVDAIEVLVYELARQVKPGEVPKLKTEVQGVVDQLLTSASSAQVVEPLTEVTVIDVPGFRFSYTYDESGTELTAVTYFLFKGKYEYEITTQSATEKWEALSGTFDAAVQSFTIQ